MIRLFTPIVMFNMRDISKFRLNNLIGVQMIKLKTSSEFMIQIKNLVLNSKL